jgi:S-adenosylmethionine decarboxylase
MTGIEWIVEAYGCSPDLLRDLATLQSLFARLVSDLDLHQCGEAQWRQFATSGGITGFTMLSESHLACHSFPEFGTLCLNLFCCRPRPEWDFSRHLGQMLAARAVHVRRLERPYRDSSGSPTVTVALQESGAHD